MKMLYSGEIGKDKLLHYALSDTELVFGAVGDGLAKLNDLAGAYFVSRSYVYIGDHFQTFSVPNMWMADGASGAGGAAFSADSGFAFSSALFDGSRVNVNANGAFYQNGYGNLAVSAAPSLFVHTDENGSDSNGGYWLSSFANGASLVSAEASGTNVLNVLFLPNSVVYVFHNVAGYNAPFGWFPENSSSFNLIGFLEPLRLYCVQSVPFFARGTVFDVVKKPAAGCRVLAYQRSSGKLIGETVSASDGSYSCPVLTARGDEIFMVCLDNDVAPDFNAQVIDRITV
ncbi:hypothetical protein [Kingella negevensis]|uniref:hypothetical protein n=1 Tax=Kingella negevensis TaxID=1522312 RepID=UPI00050A1F9D|nr:hypothetical protein [Kingella negevensis]